MTPHRSVWRKRGVCEARLLGCLNYNYMARLDATLSRRQLFRFSTDIAAYGRIITLLLTPYTTWSSRFSMSTACSSPTISPSFIVCSMCHFKPMFIDALKLLQDDEFLIPHSTPCWLSKRSDDAYACTSLLWIYI